MGVVNHLFLFFLFPLFHSDFSQTLTKPTASPERNSTFFYSKEHNSIPVVTVCPTGTSTPS